MNPKTRIVGSIVNSVANTIHYYKAVPGKMRLNLLYNNSLYMCTHRQIF
jgi:hypothetical protein